MLCSTDCLYVCVVGKYQRTEVYTRPSLAHLLGLNKLTHNELSRQITSVLREMKSFSRLCFVFNINYQNRVDVSKVYIKPDLNL